MMLVDSQLRIDPLLMHHLVLAHSLMLVDMPMNLYWWRWLPWWRDIMMPVDSLLRIDPLLVHPMLLVMCCSEGVAIEDGVRGRQLGLLSKRRRWWWRFAAVSRMMKATILSRM